MLYVCLIFWRCWCFRCRCCCCFVIYRRISHSRVKIRVERCINAFARRYKRFVVSLTVIANLHRLLEIRTCRQSAVCMCVCVCLHVIEMEKQSNIAEFTLCLFWRERNDMNYSSMVGWLASWLTVWLSGLLACTCSRPYLVFLGQLDAWSSFTCVFLAGFERIVKVHIKYTRRRRGRWKERERRRHNTY